MQDLSKHLYASHRFFFFFIITLIFVSTALAQVDTIAIV